MVRPFIVTSWRCNDTDRWVASFDQFNGRDMFDIRRWRRGDDGKMTPGGCGIFLSVKHLPRLAAAVTEALEEARRQGLVERVLE